MRLTPLIRFIPLLSILISCSGSKKILSTTENTALFLPPTIEAYVDMFIDEVDGKETKFNLADSAQVDEGNHKVLVRLEYQPASGSSVAVGALGNMLLRFATNKTFRTTLDIKVERNVNYRFVVKDFDNGFDIILFNETKKREELNYRFTLSDGKFEREF
jgi:hypothetical protein